MRRALLVLLASCAHHAPPVSAPAPVSETEAQLASVAASMRRILPHPCHDTCCADIPDFLAVSEHSPKLDPPRGELRRIATGAKDPLVRALAVTWLSTANDPADLDAMRTLAMRDEKFLWFWNNDVGGARCPQIRWDIATLGQVALDAAGHVLGRPFAVPEQLDDWRRKNPDAKATPEFWRAHEDLIEELWVRDPFLYLHVMLEGSSGETAWRAGFSTILPPSIARRDRHIVPALARHAEIFTQLDDGAFAEHARTCALDFAVRYFNELGLARFAATWSKVLQDTLDMTNGTERSSVVPLAVLASRSGGGAGVLMQTLDRLVHVDDAPLYGELLARFPTEMTPWMLKRPLAGRISALQAIAISGDGRAKYLARLLIETLTDRELFEILPRVMAVVMHLEPSWEPPDPDTMNDWEKQKLPGFLARSLVVTMDSIRKVVSTW